MTRRPICFVAMAFGHSDTDQLYKRHIRPVLARNGITPVIVNQIASNDDLNIQIIERLTSADFCIADLTYARPSVYFEAGYAQRKTVVVYTARKDHIGRKAIQDDRRVHFDLQMKPIIDWLDSNDRTFSSRLERRINKTFLKQWKINQAKNDELTTERNNFSALSLKQKLAELRKETLKFLESQGFTKWYISFREEPKLHSNPAQFADTDRAFISEKKARDGSRTVLLQVTESFSLKQLKTFDNLVLPFFGMKPPTEHDLKTGNSIIKHYLISLGTLPASRIEKAFPEFSIMDNGIYQNLETSVIKSKPFRFLNVLIFLSNIRSVTELRDKLKRTKNITPSLPK